MITEGESNAIGPSTPLTSVNISTLPLLSNVSVDAVDPALVIGNLTSGVTYVVTAAAATNAGLGPPSPASSMRIDPASRLLLDDHYARYLIIIYFI